MEINIWPDGPFSYYCKGRYSMGFFRKQLRAQWGINAPYPAGEFEFCYIKQNGNGLEVCFRPEPNSTPAMIWRAI